MTEFQKNIQEDKEREIKINITDEFKTNLSELINEVNENNKLVFLSNKERAMILVPVQMNATPFQTFVCVLEKVKNDDMVFIDCDIEEANE